MADLLDTMGEGDNVGGYTYAGQTLWYHGGGMRRMITPEGGDNETFEAIQHRAIVPIALARMDDATLERPESNDSLGEANQPVTGGLTAPVMLMPFDQWSYEFNASPASYVVPVSVKTPRTTLAPEMGY